jgi:hypothetical protein
MDFENIMAQEKLKSNYRNNFLPYDNEISKLRNGTITKFASRFLLNERGVRSRILYAGLQQFN